MEVNHAPSFETVFVLDYQIKSELLLIHSGCSAFKSDKRKKLNKKIRVKMKSNAKQTNSPTKVTTEAAGDLIRRKRAAVTRITIRFNQIVSCSTSRFVVEILGSNQRL